MATTLTSDDLNAIAAAVWGATSRTLSASPGSAVGPSAAGSDCDIYATAFVNGTVRLCAVGYLNGAYVTAEAVSGITYTIYLLDEHDPDYRCPVDGQTAVTLTPANVLFDTLQSDAHASGYNFCHTIPIEVNPAFTLAGRTYLVEYTVTPVAGEKAIIRFRVRCV